jgi:RNA polymerase sigma-70 factor (ECF subfamily)
MARPDRHRLFEQILEENRARLHIIARASVGADECQDVGQEILLALWNSLDRYEGRSSPKTWFYAVASNTISNFRRRRHRRVREAPWTDAVEALAGSPGQERDPMIILEEFTRSLDELDRLVFLMYLDDVTYREMSDVLGIEEASLRVRLSRVKKQYEARYLRR